MIRLIEDVLIRVDDQGNLVPGLADSWELSPDLKTWTFHLKPDVPFQGGYGNVTSEDVKFSWEQYLNPDSNQSTSPLLSQAVCGDISNFEIVDDQTFKVHACDPVIYLATTLSQAIPGLPITSKKYFEDKGTDYANTHPLGSGPFEFVSSTPGEEVVLKAVENHWRQTSAFKQITIKIIPDEAARLAQVQTGAVDLVPLSPPLMAEAAAAGLQSFEIPDVGTAMMALGGQYYAQPDKNDCSSPWIQCDNPAAGTAIREAMSLAIDRQSILTTFFQDRGTLTHAFGWEWPATRPSTVDPSWTLPVYDPNLAKQKLAEGGYPDGFAFSQWIYLDVPGSVDAGEAVAGMWENIGLTVKREVVEYRPVVRPTLMDQSTAGHAFMYFQSNYAECVQSIATANTKDARFQAYSNPAIDKAYDLMSVEGDKSVREAECRDMMSTLMADWVGVPLFTVDSPWAASQKVGSWPAVAGYELPTNIEYITPKG